ncbi:unnamed protein product [Candidula unifasciata]|uniref:G-protein coupled receptors family 1 profile domain-containing protein n=1 Tax=Candidula unifasciata TaxID=100452 RepID=A0A8S3YTY0_9EUPU|nr:unnamed protein product [Candidula unifasciata]
MEFITPLNILLSTAGVVLNLANITVFLRQDWRTNNVTLTLLSLSITDFLIVLTCLIFDLFSIFQTALPTSTVDFPAVQYYIVAWSIAMFSDISSLTTVLVSLERCLCIVMPLHVQSLFSVKRTLTFLGSLWILVGVSYTALFSTSTLNFTYDQRFNNSRLTVSLSKERMTVETIHNISNTIVLPSFCELTVFVNTVVMVIGLKRSSNFQRKSTNISSGHHSNHASSPKYKRLVTVVCCISSIFIACNTPTVVFIYCKHFVPGFSYAGDYRDSYAASMYSLFLLYAVNASVNFFVYVSLNRRFRDKLKEILGLSGSGVPQFNLDKC